MNNVQPFARHFAQLVWLLVHRADDQEAQKEVLRLALAELTDKQQDLVHSDLTFAVANAFHDSRLSELFTWMSELSVRMSAHAVRAIEFGPGAAPHDVLGLAQALTTAPTPGDEGAAFDEQVVALSPKGIAVHIGSSGFVRRATPSAAHLQIPGPARSPIVGVRTASGTFHRIPTPSPSPVVAADDPPEVDDVTPPGRGIADEMPRILQSELAPGLAPAPRLKDLLARLDAANDATTAAKLIDDVARETEERAREGLWVDLALVLDRLHSRCERLPEGDLKRGYSFAIRRLEKPALMQGIAQLLPRRRELRDMVTKSLIRSGESGADALIDLLVSSESTTERRAYRTALLLCAAAIPALVHLLGDGRWFVVRNAVELLAELAPADADAKIAGVLSHNEPRVRRAAAAALAKLGTARAVLALLQAVHDSSPEVRLQVVLGLGTVRNPRAVPWLVEAMDKETDADVQAALVAALGKMPTEDAVARLARAVEPGGVLIRKSVAARLLAIDALIEAGTPSALAVLRGLQNDRDREVREAVSRVLSDRSKVGDGL